MDYIAWELRLNEAILKRGECIQRNMPCSCAGRTITVKMSKLHKAVYTFSTIPIKMLTAFFMELEQS